MASKKISLITLNPILVDLNYIAPLAPRLIAILDEGFKPGSEIVIDAD